MAAVASSYGAPRMQAADLNGPVDDSYGERRRERRPSPSYDIGQAGSSSRAQDSGWQRRDERRQTPERELGNGASGGYHSQQPYQGNGGGGGRRNWGNGGAGANGRGGDFFAERRAQREASTVTIWPPSPKAPRSDSESDSDAERRHRKKRKKDKKHSSSSKKRSSKRYSDDDDSSDSDSEDDSRRRSSKKSKKSKRSSKYSEDDEDRRKRKEKKQSRSSRKQRDRSRSGSRDRVRNEQEDEWAEKGVSSKSTVPGDGQLAIAAAPADKVGLTSSKGKSKETIDGNDTSDDDDVGPKPLQEAVSKTDAREYGGALLRGEGEAMAAFVAEGQRIPRRGEIGLESHEIEKFEAAGFVMSGSRHRRMNAVRIRKENQVISAEEKRGILKLQKDEQAKKEAMIVGSFKELVERRLEGERKANAKRQASQDAE